MKAFHFLATLFFLSNISVAYAQYPTAVCKNITVSVNGNCFAKIDPSDIDGGSFYGTYLSISQQFFDCDDLGVNTVTLAAHSQMLDAQAGTSTEVTRECTATVTVVKDLYLVTDFCDNIVQDNEPGGLPKQSEATLNNSVFYNNGSGKDIRNAQGAMVLGTKNYTQQAPSAYGDGTPPGFTQLTTDPFVRSGDADGSDNQYGTNDDGLFPGGGGVLVDAGAPGVNAESIDVLGHARVYNEKIDIGAYEKGSN